MLPDFYVARWSYAFYVAENADLFLVNNRQSIAIRRPTDIASMESYANIVVSLIYFWDGEWEEEDSFAESNVVKQGVVEGLALPQRPPACIWPVV
jgi:hypothetical protein